jgi:hypothetical protein
MARTSRLWIPVLVGLLVAGALGFGGGGAVATEPRVTTATIMIPAAAFIPATDGEDYHTYGEYLQALIPSSFFAPLTFPVPVVNIKKITMYVHDDSLTEGVCVWLNRAAPSAADSETMGGVCTSGTSTVNPQVLSSTDIDPRRVNTANYGPYLYMDLAPGVNFYGVKILYSY